MQGVLRSFLLNGRKARNNVFGHLSMSNPTGRPVMFSRCESTATISLKNSGLLDQKSDTMSYAEAKRLLRLVDVETVKVKLGMEGKEVIGYSELLKVCESTGVARSTDEAASFARVLDEAGVVLLFRDRVYLYPDKVADLVRRSVPLALTPEDDPQREELEKLQEKKIEIDALAHKQVRRVLWSGLGIAVAQVGLFFRLTFWDLSWDIMEPITFFSGSASILLGYAYFLFTSRDPSYQDLRKRLFLSRQQKLLKKHNFDVSKFKELQERSNVPIDRSHSGKGRFESFDEDTIFKD